MGPILQPTAATCALAAAAVVAGAPWFASGLRTLRLRRHLTGLQERPLAEEPTGFVMVRGLVALESPLVGPLSGRPCAGFRLEVRRTDQATLATIEERRFFRLVAGGISALLRDPDRATWDLSVVAERAVAPEEPLTANLAALLARSPEAAWLRRCGVPLILIERSLLAGQECFVIGSARHARPAELAEAAVELAEAQWARTGTDDLPPQTAAPRNASPSADLWIEAGGLLEFLRVSDRAPALRPLMPSWWRVLGLVLGPLTGIAGLLYLAGVVERLPGF